MPNKLEQYRKLADDLAANRTSRRDFLKRSSALGLSTPMMSALLGVTGSALALSPKVARADSHGDNQIVVASWGGGFGDAQRAAQFTPFTEETGIEVVLAPQQPEIALLQAQVESGNVEWDLSNNSFVGAYTLANKGFLEELDYSAMNADIVDGHQPPGSRQAQRRHLLLGDEPRLQPRLLHRSRAPDELGGVLGCRALSRSARPHVHGLRAAPAGDSPSSPTASRWRTSTR